MGSLDEIAFLAPQPREKTTFFHNLKSSFRVMGGNPRATLTTKTKDVNKLSVPLKGKESKDNDNKMPNLMCFSPSKKETNIEDVFFNFYGPIHYPPLPSEPTLKKASSISTINSTADEKQNEVRKDPALSTRSTSELTLSCLNYQAKNYAEHHQKWALTKKEDYAFAEQITKVVCTVLEIGRPRPPDDPGETFNPLVFYAYPYVLEELFCEAYILYNRTGKEMSAKTNSDIPKVLTVIQDQLYYSLHPYFLEGVKNKHMGKPTSLEQMRENLLRINYKKIEEKRKEDRKDRMKQDLKHKPLYVEYRKSRKSDILELIKKQRLQFAQAGEHFPKVNNKGEILKDQTSFLSVNKKQSKLITGDCWDSPKRCDHSRFIPIEDIVDVSMGKQSKYYKDIFLHNENWLVKAPTNAPEHWNWLMSLKMKDNSYMNFCARNLKSAHYWVDSIHIILGKSMGSITMTEELNEILDLEVQLHFLDIEMLPIPDIPPVIPPLPSNFDFVIKEKRRNRTGVVNFARTAF